MHNGKIGVIMESVKKTYKVYPGLVRDKLLPECILDSLSIGDVVQKVLIDFDEDEVDCDLPFANPFVNLDYCQFNSFVYHLYHLLSHFLTISFGDFYQLVLDTVDVKDGD